MRPPRQFQWHERAISRNPNIDTLCRSGTSRNDTMRLRAGASGRIDRSFVHQHDGDAVPHRINAAALGALETLPFVFQYQRLFADRADQNFEQVLVNHGGILLL